MTFFILFVFHEPNALESNVRDVFKNAMIRVGYECSQAGPRRDEQFANMVVQTRSREIFVVVDASNFHIAIVAEWSKAVDLSLFLKLYWGDPRAFEPHR